MCFNKFYYFLFQTWKYTFLFSICKMLKFFNKKSNQVHLQSSAEIIFDSLWNFLFVFLVENYPFFNSVLHLRWKKDLSAGKIDENKLKCFLRKVRVWNYAKISMREYQNLSKQSNNRLYWNFIIMIWLFIMVRKVKFCAFLCSSGKGLYFDVFWVWFLAFFSLVLCLI